MFADRKALQAGLHPRDEASLQEAPAFKHVLTHKDLYLHPVLLRLPQRQALALEGQWFDPAQIAKLGLPAPIKKMLSMRLCGSDHSRSDVL
jgi:A/G-specific adenine glycosylase